MGVDASDDDAARRALHERELRPWRRWLAPVHVVRISTVPAAIEITLPEHDATAGIHWTLLLETGERYRGVVEAAQGECLDRRDVDGTPHARFRVSLGEIVPPGYHRVELRVGETLRATQSYIVVPEQAYVSPRLGASRCFGPATQLYALRSAQDIGIGDFGSLEELIGHCAQHGADVIGVSPLHALFLQSPAHASPYSPSSRLFLNTLYTDIESVPEFQGCAAARARLAGAAPEIARLRAAERVDYEAVARIKHDLLEVLYAHFRETAVVPDTDRARVFRNFVAAGGRDLRCYARFEALSEHFHSLGIQGGWTAWPEAYHDPDSPACDAFADERHERVEYFLYRQWVADEQIRRCAQRARKADLSVGLYKDLAVSAAPDGAEVWTNRQVFARAVTVGCPPDDFNLQGQNWGLPPYSPDALIESAYQPFVSLLRASMRDAGALRIDHVMGLLRLFWIPEGASGVDGAYVHYPFDDLVGILSLESHRNRCLIIGEDLGTVPDEVRAGLGAAGVLSYRVFWFERDGGGFKHPRDWPEQAIATVSTHDLPTLAGFWVGDDLAERARLGLFPSEQMRQKLYADRSLDRERLLAALINEGLLPPDAPRDTAAWPEMTPALARAAHAFVARTRSRIAMLQLEDLIGFREQVNLPGTSAERANWRLRLPMTIDGMFADSRVRDTFLAMCAERGVRSDAADPAAVSAEDAIANRAGMPVGL
jgi:(1->4)-alpha-D-glucan 1-alpha-D-glucosylmutase